MHTTFSITAILQLQNFARTFLRSQRRSNKCSYSVFEGVNKSALGHCGTFQIFGSAKFLRHFKTLR
eukprot:m.24774 g.24774  ORF g.24774 m.24774 type:complete len:66 (-) comp5695_c0_seq3:663-860(-)